MTTTTPAKAPATGGKGRGGGGQPVDHGAGGEHEDDTARKDKMGGNQYGAPPVVGAEARPGANEDYGRLELTRRGEGGAYGETTFGQDDDGTEMERVDDNDRRPVRRDNRPSLEETARKKMARLAYSALGLSVLGLVGLSVMIAGVALGWFGKSTPEIDPPIAKDDESLGNQPGAAVTVDVLAVDEPGVAAIDPTTVMIVGAGGDGKRLAVKGEGTWTVDKASGKITFTPESGLTGNPEPIRYQVYDTVGNVSRAAKVTVTYDQAKPPAAPPMAKPIIVAGFSGVASGSGGTETPVTVDVPANVEKGDFGIDKASVVITNTMLLEGEATPTPSSPNRPTRTGIRSATSS